MEIKRIELETYPKLCKDIPLLREEISEMESGNCGVVGDVISDYRTGQPRAQVVRDFDWELYHRRKAQLHEMEKRKARIDAWLEEIEDVRTRTVFKMCYKEEKSWADIAKALGYRGNPDYPRLHIRDAYLKKMGIK